MSIQKSYALAAELRAWRVILITDEEINGLPASIVYENAADRAEYLQKVLEFRDPEEILASASTAQRDAAFLSASVSMKEILSMIEGLSRMEPLGG